MTRVLVTGGGGQLGREFALLLGADAVALGRAELDVADEESVARAFALRRPELVLHCAAWSIDIDGDNCLAVYIPGQVAHGFEALTDVVLCYHVTEEYDPADPDEHNVRWDDERVRGLWSTTSPTLSARDA